MTVTVLLIVKSLSSVLLPFVIAWFLAYLVYPVVRFVQYRLHVPGRALSIIVTMLLLIVVLGGVFYMIVPPMIEQFERLTDILNKFVNHNSSSTTAVAFIKDWLQDNRHEIEKFLKSPDFTNMIKSAMPKVFSVVGQTANVVVSIVASFITLLYMFFILLDYEYLSENWIRIFPEKHRPFWHELMGDAKEALNNYVRGQGLVALIMGILFCIGFTIIDFPMAIGLGIMIGIMDLVPYLHTFALIPTVLLALLKAADTGQSFWIILLGALIVFIVVQIICDMVVTPKVMGSAMGMNPAILLLSLSVWGALLGFIGLIIALPLTSLLIAYYQRYVTKESKKGPLNEKSPE